MPTRVGCTRLALVLLAAALLAPTLASARSEELRWTHPDPQGLQRFEALVGTASGSYGSPISLGLPQPDGQGVYTASITVGDNVDVYVAVRAIGGDGLASVPSNEKFRPAPTSSGSETGSGGSTGGSTSEPSGGSGGLDTGTVIPPHPDAIVRFDFDGGNAPDWRDTMANNSMTQDATLFTVDPVGGNQTFYTVSSDTNIHSHFVGAPSDFSNVVLTGRMAVDASGAGIGVTTYSQYPSADVYYRLRTTGNGSTFQLSSHPAGCSDNTGVVPQPNVWYQFELSVSSDASSNVVRATIWPQGSTKPATPQAQCTDTSASRPRSGTVGVWAMGSGGKYWDDLEVVGLAGSSSGGSSDPVEPLDPPILISVDPVE